MDVCGWSLYTQITICVGGVCTDWVESMCLEDLLGIAESLHQEAKSKKLRAFLIWQALRTMELFALLMQRFSSGNHST